MYTKLQQYECVTSTSNKSVRFLQGLAKRRNREESRCFFLEGARAVGELSTAGAELKQLVISRSYAENVAGGGPRAAELDRLLMRAREVILVSDAVFKSIAETVTPQGIGAVIAYPAHPDADALLQKAERILVLENIQDPGNLGTCIRTADAFAFDAVFCIADCVDAYNAKVVRSTVGSMFHLPVLNLSFDVPALAEKLNRAGFTLYGAHPRGGQNSCASGILEGKTALLIGNEGAGLSEAAKRACNQLVTVPMPGNAESLNAGIAASVLMYEVIRRKEETK